jgi:hypothetical protein
MSPDKEMVLRESDLLSALKRMKKDTLKCRLILRDHLNGLFLVPEEIFAALCELISGILMTEKVIESLTTEENRIEGGYCKVSAEQLIMFTSTLKLLEYVRQSLPEFGIVLEEM